ncbi:hypothetical protein CL655_02750 [bacterium]|nr:hypothetical protein [bacterium]|tara:strand:+ start:190 stop:798 length:609 start_codon:yes stop_codon:yes gene_type:complete
MEKDIEEKKHTLTKKERHEIKRAEKQSAREKEIRMKKVKSWIPWIVFSGVVVGLIYWAVVAAQKAEESRPGEPVAIMSKEHVNASQAVGPYNSNPPTSGPHAGPAPWGVNTKEIPDVNAIHNLEHGGVWISYKNLDAESVSALEEIARKNSRSVILSPRAANDANIAVASWGRLMKLDAVDEERIIEFIRRNKNKSPEPLAI